MRASFEERGYFFVWSLFPYMQKNNIPLSHSIPFHSIMSSSSKASKTSSSSSAKDVSVPTPTPTPTPPAPAPAPTAEQSSATFLAGVRENRATVVASTPVQNSGVLLPARRFNLISTDDLTVEPPKMYENKFGYYMNIRDKPTGSRVQINFPWLGAFPISTGQIDNDKGTWVENPNKPFSYSMQLKANQAATNPEQAELKQWCDKLDQWILKHVALNGNDLFDKPKGSASSWTEDALRQTMNDTFRTKSKKKDDNQPPAEYAGISCKFPQRKSTELMPNGKPKEEINLYGKCFLQVGKNAWPCDPYTTVVKGSKVKVTLELANIYSQKSTKNFGIKFIVRRMVIDNSGLNGVLDPGVIDELNSDPDFAGVKFSFEPVAAMEHAGTKRSIHPEDDEYEEYDESQSGPG